MTYQKVHIKTVFPILRIVIFILDECAKRNVQTKTMIHVKLFVRLKHVYLKRI